MAVVGCEVGQPGSRGTSRRRGGPGLGLSVSDHIYGIEFFPQLLDMNLETPCEKRIHRTYINILILGNEPTGLLSPLPSPRRTYLVNQFDDCREFRRMQHSPRAILAHIPTQGAALRLSELPVSAESG